MNKLEQEVIAAIAQETDIEESEINFESTLYDLGIDSLSSLEILVVLEDKYDIRISENELRNIAKVKDILKIISEKLSVGKG